MKKVLSLIVVLTIIMSMIALPAFAVEPVNLIENGDFDDIIIDGAEPTSFGSDYNWWNPLVTGTWDPGLGPEYRYTVGTNPYLYHSAWTSFEDHTVGDTQNQMMIVNAKPTTPAMIVWEQNVTIPPRETIIPAEEYELWAGKNELVGDVLVKNEDGSVCVKFVLNPEAIAAGWLISEAHVAVGDDVSDIPNKNGNPIPGQFPINEYIDPGVTETGWYCLEANGTAPYIIAAHAVVTKMDCVVNAAAPYGPSEVIDTLQGLRYDNTPVKTIRSNSLAALIFEGTKLETDFYSLGFGPGDAVDDAYLTVRFNTPIINGTGADLQIVEDTWGLPYPVESCAVYASEDGINWTYLGEANNQTPLPDGVHTFTNFDFDLGSLVSASYVKVEDTSIRSAFSGLAASQGATLDGFDVNAIISLQTNKTCTEYSETAWGGDNEFSGKNWAKYISYTPGTEAVARDYLFTFWAANSHPDNPAVLEAYFGDHNLGTLDLNTIDGPITGTWKAFSVTIEDPEPGEYTIKIVDTFTIAWGDDFCIDDISLEEKP